MATEDGNETAPHRRRYGRFYIASDLLNEADLFTVFGWLQFVPLAVHYSPWLARVEYLGLSPHFDFVESGLTYPLYTVSVTETPGDDGDPPTLRFSVQRCDAVSRSLDGVTGAVQRLAKT